ncbi:hypothetical protein ACFL6S_20750 [Candidatus Poribacteria bacterium]
MSIIDLDIADLWTEKIEQLSDMVMRIARGDEDYFQVGILGLREGLLRDPYANDSYLLQAARFAMNNFRNKGRSIDNGSRHSTTKKLLDGTVKTYRKDMVPVYIDKLVSEFGLEFPDHSYTPDILAIDRICAEQFYGSLDEEEAEFIDACMLNRNGDFSERKTMQKLGIGTAEYHKVKEDAYHKFIRAFGTDEDLGKLGKRIKDADYYH